MNQEHLTRRVRIVLALLVMFIAGLSSVSSVHAAKRPNILWIVSEDNGPFLGCYGYPDANTPHLDKLATQGVLYQNAFANAPVCAPARCTLITGIYPPSLGTQHMRSKNAVPADRIPFFTQYLRDAGYFCTNNSKTDYNLSPYQKDAWDQMSKGDHKKRKDGQPFFAVYNIGTSHESSLHRGLDKSLGDAKVTLPPYHPDTPEIRANWAMYHKILTRMDSQVGDILAKLEKEGVADDTIVIYYADHGGILTRSKRFLYDTGVHVPMIARFGKNFAHLAPSKAGSKTDRLVSFVDLAPTVLSLAGIDVPKHMQGEAFLGKQAKDERDYVYCFRGRMDERYDLSRAVRDKQYKYVRNYNPHRIYGQNLNYLWKMPATKSWEAMYKAGKCEGPQKFFWEPKPVEELYDTTKDYWEVKNLANDPKHADVLKRMREANKQHMLAIRDSGFLPEGMMQDEADDKPIHDLVRDNKRYPLQRVMASADIAIQGKPENLAELKAMLSDDLPVIRYWGATGCLILKDKAMLLKKELTESLSDESGDVQVVAAEALTYIGETEKGLNALAALLSHKNEWVALRAANALEALGDKAKPVQSAIAAAAKKSKNYVNRATTHTADALSKP